MNTTSVHAGGRCARGTRSPASYIHCCRRSIVLTKRCQPG